MQEEDQPYNHMKEEEEEEEEEEATCTLTRRFRMFLEMFHISKRKK